MTNQDPGHFYNVAQYSDQHTGQRGQVPWKGNALADRPNGWRVEAHKNAFSSRVAASVSITTQTMPSSTFHADGLAKTGVRTRAP